MYAGEPKIALLNDEKAPISYTDLFKIFINGYGKEESFLDEQKIILVTSPKNIEKNGSAMQGNDLFVQLLRSFNRPVFAYGKGMTATTIEGIENQYKKEFYGVRKVPGIFLKDGIGGVNIDNALFYAIKKDEFFPINKIERRHSFSDVEEKSEVPNIRRINSLTDIKKDIQQ